MARRRRNHGSGLDAWPGYVDALSTLLMVITFVLLVFVLAQAFLSVALSKRQQVLEQLNHQMAELSQMLGLEQAKNKSLELRVATLGTTLGTLTSERDTLRGQLDSAQKLTTDQAAQVATLDQQLDQLRAQMTAIAQALDISQKTLADRDAKIADLGNKLNIALADRVNELKRYRSEFFGKLSEVLKNRPGIRVVGDRFVFQSEVLFPPGSAELSPQGTVELDKFATALRDISKEIPADLPWILRVDGHADHDPISSTRFASNWELSAARAISVVKLLIARGIPANRLAATGFADTQPLDAGHTAEAYAKNRRIEMRLTDR
ncbi:chemotaxis protein MotB [Endobacter medicaginis]|uniref:Chemotaxis protein MotB n=1 Tax=Endobacter medicaginis TaxID=1181271 RepID=A0A850NWB8_9PROT|nr:peptidoglycan -binding protein [Endobacter medicaginis]MBB3173634.1 chemotaxis protein MotB [Endobacter medicaginis]MCX5477076.1 peptidoglycan -binding protein [Endobacter medicaginis]NVN31128.1 peptidoglycan -binding protein [Endobacter medicaginis]